MFTSNVEPIKNGEGKVERVRFVFEDKDTIVKCDVDLEDAASMAGTINAWKNASNNPPREPHNPALGRRTR